MVLILVAIGFTMLAVRTTSLRERDRTLAEQRQRELNAELAVVAERERVASDVHDILGHSLTVISVKTELAGKLIDLDPQRAKSELAELNQLARAALGEVRSTVGQLRTPDLSSTLAAAESALRAAGIDVDLPSADSQPRNNVLFAWALREAVTNVVRHSNATRCTVAISDTSLTVSDNGSGASTTVFGNGLQGLAQRVDDAGGVFGFRSGATRTTLSVTLT